MSKLLYFVDTQQGIFAACGDIKDPAFLELVPRPAKVKHEKEFKNSLPVGILPSE